MSCRINDRYFIRADEFIVDRFGKTGKGFTAMGARDVLGQRSD